MEKIFVGAVKNHEGKYFKSFSNYSGYTWTDEIKKAKIFTKIGVAKRRVTLIVNYNRYKKISEPIPVITEFVISSFVDIDQTDRINAAIEKERRRQAEVAADNAVRSMVKLEQEYLNAQDNYEKAKQHLDKLANKIQNK